MLQITNKMEQTKQEYQCNHPDFPKWKEVRLKDRDLIGEAEQRGKQELWDDIDKMLNWKELYLIKEVLEIKQKHGLK